MSLNKPAWRGWSARRGRHWVCLWALCWSFPVGVSLPSAWGQPMVSQAIGVKAPIVDEFGEVLQGTDPSADLFGNPVVEGDVVQVLHATDNTIYPPATDGTPDPRNVLLMTCRIGHGTLPSAARPGRVGAALTPRPGGNSKIFVRVFNAPMLEAASFYGDSQVFTVKSWANEVFTADIPGTDQPLDDGDDDGDGLINAWEKSLGTDPHAGDSDGDGLSDLKEKIAGTDANDSESVFVLANIQPSGNADLKIVWDTAAGRHYTVEYASDNLSGTPTYTSMGTLEGTGEIVEYVIPGGLSDAQGCYRVRVAE